MNEIETAYIAGVFDGEGCISISKSKPHGEMVSPAYVLDCRIGMTDKDLLDWICKTTELGKVAKNIYNQKRGYKLVWQWWIRSGDARLLLQELLPYLRVKRDQAILALEFYALGTRRSGKYGKVEQSMLDLKEQYRQRLSDLK